MKVTVVITNYNYADYIIECVDSVLNQTYKNVEIIFIDDDSKDSSVEILNKNYSDIENLIIIKKENGGQLSAFNKAVKYVTGEIVFFLDSDDIYKPNYIEKAVDFYKQNPKCDFLFCKRDFIDENGKKLIINKTKRIFPLKREYGYTPLATYMTNQWIGAATSCISMKKSLLKKILPIPFESEWITRADDCLVWGASLKLGNKYFLNESLVQYRIHGNNYHHGKTITKDKQYLRSLSINKLFAFFTKDYNNHQLQYMISQEFSSLPEKKLEDLKIYLRALAKSNISNIFKLRQALSIFKNLLER